MDFDFRKLTHEEFMALGVRPEGRTEAWKKERTRRYRNEQAKMYRRMKKETVNGNH